MEGQRTKYTFQELGLFNQLIRDYLNGDVDHLVTNKGGVTGYTRQIEAKFGSYSLEERNLLNEVLTDQYHKVKHHDAVLQNLSKLQLKDAYTVVTGHQLNIFSGPLYFIYKICDVIKTARELSSRFKGVEVVPVFWMAAEDHDFEEIASFHLFGEKYTWDKESQQWPVGRLDTSGLYDILKALDSKFDRDQLGQDLLDLFKSSYQSSANLADAVRTYVNDLFGEFGLVIIDGDHPKLKQSFANIMIQEVESNIAWNNVKTTVKNHFSNYKVQVNPRFVNLFYIDDNNRRLRIDFEDNRYRLIGTELNWTKEELIALIQSNPERFSPNVVLRPVYQELVLPNLAYIGGAGEISYWLELKSTFEAFKVSYPILKVRNSFTFLNGDHHKKIGAWDIAWSDLFLNEHDLINIVLEDVVEPFQLNVDPINDYYDQLSEKLSGIDPNLLSSLDAEKAKALKGVANIAAKANKSLKSKHEVKINQVKKLKADLFPNGGLQERTNNILSLYGPLGGQEWIMSMIEEIDAFESRMIIQ